jgi:hypothetical protein
MVYCQHMVLVNDKIFQMRTSEDFLRRIDDWRRFQPDLPSRAEAIRRLIKAGLGTAKTPASLRLVGPEDEDRAGPEAPKD